MNNIQQMKTTLENLIVAKKYRLSDPEIVALARKLEKAISLAAR